MNMYAHFFNHLSLIYRIIVSFNLFYLIIANNVIDYIDAVFSERIKGLKTNVKSVSNQKLKSSVLSFVLIVSSIKYSE
jgi:hypothetical protein